MKKKSTMTTTRKMPTELITNDSIAVVDEYILSWTLSFSVWRILVIVAFQDTLTVSVGHF